MKKKIFALVMAVMMLALMLTGCIQNDIGVKILIAVVIGALLLAGLYALFNTTIMPTVTQKIQELFNYKG